MCRSEVCSTAVCLDRKSNLVPVADILLREEFAQLDFDYVGDFEITLMVDPELPKPYYTEVDGATEEYCATLAEGRQAFEELKSDLLEAAAEKGGLR